LLSLKIPSVARFGDCVQRLARVQVNDASPRQIRRTVRTKRPISLVPGASITSRPGTGWTSAVPGRDQSYSSKGFFINLLRKF